VWTDEICLKPRLFSDFAAEQWAKARVEVQDYDPLRLLAGPGRPPAGDPGWDPRYMKWYTHGYYLLKGTTWAPAPACPSEAPIFVVSLVTIPVTCVHT